MKNIQQTVVKESMNAVKQSFKEKRMPLKLFEFLEQLIIDPN